MPSIPIMPFVILVLFLIPVKLSPYQLKKLAFSIWLAGGVVLCMLGITRLMEAPETAPVVLAISIVAAIVIGVAKGKFILGKTTNRNLERLNAMTENKKPIHVYSVRSWIVIALMVAISIALNLADVSLLLRGAVNLGIGLALIVSSFVYTTQPKHSLS